MAIRSNATTGTDKEEVSVYIHNRYAYTTLTDIVTDGFESLWINVLLPKTKPIQVGVCYRPPTQLNFIELFNNSLSHLRSDCETYILGDTNIDFPSTHPLFNAYKQELNLFDLSRLIDEPTRMTDSSRTTIDHILTNRPDNILQHGVIPTGLSDHYLIFCSRRISKGHFKNHSTVKVRSLKNYSSEILLEKLCSVDWKPCFLSDCVNIAWTMFQTSFMNILDEVAPVKEIRVKQRTEPWMTNDILEMLKERDRALYTFRKSGLTEDYKKFCSLRNKLQREIKVAKSNYFSDMIEQDKDNPKKLWQHLKDIGLKNKGKDSDNICLCIDGEICHDSKSVANHFNDFFTNVASALVSKLPTASNVFNIESTVFKSFYKQKESQDRDFVLKKVSEDFVYKELLKLNPSKSTGLDEIPARFVRDGASVLKIPITFIVNLSLSSGKVPHDMKVARVKPLYKKNSSLEAGNYRPVSILSIVSKILEKCVHSQLHQSLDSNDILYEFQSGFRSKYSTDTCLIHLYDYLKTKTSKGLYTGMLLLDLQKAFDTVDHDILCRKLEAICVRSVPWFKSYLSGRQQFVHINNVSSDPGYVTCGVPQGSILGPLLFLIYVNDMPISLDSECKLILYADDSAILFSHKDPHVISQKLENTLDMCSQWLVDNKLSLHLGKTECVLFGPKRKLKDHSDFCVQYKGHCIKSTNKVKYLGVIIDNSLSGDSTVDSIVKKVNCRLKFLYRQARFLDVKCKMSLCSALVQCHLDCACSAWYSGLSKTLKHRLQVCQNKMVRFILDMSPRDSINYNVLSSIQILNIEDRVKQLRLNHVYNIFNDRAPSYLRENFVLKSIASTRHTRSSSNLDFVVPFIKTCQSGTFYYNGIKDWNDLPKEVKVVKSKDVFKKSVKNLLLDKGISRHNSDFVFY